MTKISERRGPTQPRHKHVCQVYWNARRELVDPATQDGIGCKVCCPPDGRVTKEQKTRSDA